MTRWLLLLVLIAGCQPAGRYELKPTASRRVTLPAEISAQPKFTDDDADLVWQSPNRYQLQTEVPLVFVAEGSKPAEWHQLKEAWNPEWHRPLTAFAVSPLGVVALGGAGWLTPSIHVKVPLGLDDPTPLIPAVNPPTFGKWQLGKDLFFDDRSFLQPDGDPIHLSCARCHQPELGYTDPKLTMRLDTPTLINAVYRRQLFWDGRVDALERVVQESLEDEKASRQRQFHSWPGVVGRLRAEPKYVQRFRAVFGSEPTQDAVGKAIATYLRTVLSANSVQDRAEKTLRDRQGKALTAADYEKVIDDAALKTLSWRHGPTLNRSQLAAELLKGHALFHGPAGCVQCHSGPTYSDGAFHNLAIGESKLISTPGKEPGRFAVAPPGEKGLHLIGAYQTPTLRALPRTHPYFHNGSYLLGGRDLDDLLFEVVLQHIKFAPNLRAILPQLDPAIQERPLKEDEIRALVVWLKALAGDPVAEQVSGR